MAIEYTLSIIKPNAVKKNVIGQIISRFETAGLRVWAIKMVKLDKTTAEQFYIEHQGKPFYDSLITFMTSGPVILIVLEGEDAVQLNRKLMGATNYEKAEVGTIRKDFADSFMENAVHGSDSLKSATREIMFFFNKAII